MDALAGAVVRLDRNPSREPLLILREENDVVADAYAQLKKPTRANPNRYRGDPLNVGVYVRSGDLWIGWTGVIGHHFDQPVHLEPSFYVDDNFDWSSDSDDVSTCVLGPDWHPKFEDVDRSSEAEMRNRLAHTDNYDVIAYAATNSKAFTADKYLSVLAPLVAALLAGPLRVARAPALRVLRTARTKRFKRVCLFGATAAGGTSAVFVDLC